MNSKEHKFQVEEINKIKYKLNKYAELKNDTKVKEYIDHLKLFKITFEILKETDIVGCLRALRARQNSAYSTPAGDLISAWKNKCNNEDTVKPAKPSSGLSEAKKTDPTKNPPVTNGKPNSMSGKPVESKQNSLGDSTLNGKKRSISDLHSESILGKSSGKTEPSRPDKTSSSNKPAVKPDDDAASKRQKLSFSDYKSLKTNDESNYRSNYSIDEFGENIEDDVNSSAFLNDIPKKSTLTKTKDENERYSPQPFGSETNKKNESKLMKAPPLPLAPLSSILPSMQAMPTSITPQYPTINPTSNHRPTTGVPKRTAAQDEEFLDKVFKSRNSKMVLYIGAKKFDGTVPKLYDLCVQTLRDTLDDLPNRLYLHNLNSDFPVAFDLLKPVLQKANAKQLENIESYSPNLMEDTDLLWKKLCEQEFKKTNPPDDDETWREFYFKKSDEREEEFKRVRNIISSKQAVKPKERQTQLATMKTNTIKTVTHFSSNGSLKSSNASNMSKMSSASSSAMRPLGAPTRVFEARRRPGFGGPPPTQKSQGMKDTLKLLKKGRR